MTLPAEFYSNCSSKKRPEKNCSAGFGDYCCIPECKSAFYTKRDGKRVKTGISLFKFPKDNTEKRRWINIISMYRRKGAGDNFSPYDESKKYFVCEHHFKADEIRVSLGIGRKTLKPGAIPSIFNFKNPSKIKPRKSPKKRCLPATNESTSNDSYLEEELETNNSNDLLLVMHSETNPDRTKLLEKEIDYLKEKMNFLEAEKNVLKAENDKQTKNEHL